MITIEQDTIEQCTGLLPITYERKGLLRGRVKGCMIGLFMTGAVNVKDFYTETYGEDTNNGR